MRCPGERLCLASRLPPASLLLASIAAVVVGLLLTAQAAHVDCHRAKGNDAGLSKWRHPELRPLPAAVEAGNESGPYLWLPHEPPPAAPA